MWADQILVIYISVGFSFSMHFIIQLREMVYFIFIVIILKQYLVQELDNIDFGKRQSFLLIILTQCGNSIIFLTFFTR